MLFAGRKSGSGLRAGANGLRRRPGQTAVEYLLVTVALVVAFALMYRVLSYSVAREFTGGGRLITTMYKESPF